MTVENQVRAFAGTVVLSGSLLAHFHSPNWLFLTAFVGANLLQSAFTKICPLEMVLKKAQKEKQ